MWAQCKSLRVENSMEKRQWEARYQAVGGTQGMRTTGVREAY